jgi:activator of HSP90 ATPase
LIPVQSASPLSRRKALTVIAASFGTLAASTLPGAHAQSSNAPQVAAPARTMAAPQPPDDDSSSPNKDRTALHYEIDFKASPQRLYEAILDPKQFAAFSGFPATIDRTPGGAFTQFGGQIEGRTVELVPNQRIVQAWRPAHWDAGIYSIAHFEFKPRAAETTLVFDHTGFPVGEYNRLDWGWQNHYWDPLKKFLS